MPELQNGITEIFPTGEELFTSKNGLYMSLRLQDSRYFFMNAKSDHDNFNNLSLDEKLQLFINA